MEHFLKIEVQPEEFPEIEVIEYGIRERFEATGFAYVLNDRVMVEYKISDLTMPEKPSD